MTFINRTPTRLAFTLLLLSLLFSIQAPAQKRRAAASAKKETKKETSKKATSRKETARNSRSERGRKESAKASRDDKRRGKASSAREERASRRDDKRGRAQSRLEARREAERRRREAIEAARRAELARQAAIARQRAADQALRDETFANISRDSTIGEDMEVRRVALAALGSHAGTVVVMDPKTGQVYTVVNQDWALRRGFKPCSTVKLVTGLAGLTEKVIDPSSTVNISSSSIDLTDSLAYSNNGYFQNVGGRVGFERMIQYARELGLGERTGINFPAEYEGRVPVYKSGYAVNHMCSHGDDFEVTPIQLANMVSAIANGGKLMVPRMPRTPQETVQFKPEVKRKLNIPQDALTRMLPGMIGAVNYGTGKGAYSNMIPAAGKTGTCIGQGSWLGLFGSFAPVGNPRLAVVVVTRGSSERGRIAASIAGKIYKGLENRFGVLSGGKDNQRMATTPADLSPRPKLDPKTAAALSDEEEGDTSTEPGGVTTDTLPSTSGASKTKSVVLTAPTRPTETTTRPAATPSTTQQKGGSINERPRRVLTTQP
ncbi:MAG TPA: penicillin-binding transpeptidase domain-containing protein [Pyrinomonadaceae bacterium]|nr:penicillin-binding transpeptidase domain-containing protein [Pyrinomonadaceae bacterium]